MLLFLVSKLNLENRLQAQTCCTAGAPISSSLEINGLDSNQLSIQFEYSFNSVNRLVEDNEVIQNDPRSRSGQNLLLKMDYAVNKRLAFSAILPFVNQRRESISQEEISNGIGDLTLLAQLNLRNPSLNILESKRDQFGIGIGVKVPSGQLFHEDDRGVVLSPDMQSGSGTFDFIVRAFHQRNQFLIPNLSVFNNISYKYNTTNQHFGDKQREAGRAFKFGNEFIFKSHFFYQTLLGTSFITPDFGIQLRVSDPNEEQSINASNSGGLWINLPLGIAMLVNKKSTIRIFGEIPVWQNIDGLQITTDYRLGIQFRHLLNLQS